MNYPTYTLEKQKDNDIKLGEKQLADVNCSDFDSINANYGGDLASHSFILNKKYDWVIVKENNRLLLVPLKK
jgi:hypothetical protein